MLKRVFFCRKLGRSAQTYYFTSRKFRNLLEHFEKCSKNLIENIETRRKEEKTDDLDAKDISKYYGLDVISKVLFAIDVDSYKGKLVLVALIL